MANRVIKDSIWDSPSLAKLTFLSDVIWPRFLLLADDWGCFNSDPEVVKGLIFPKRKGIGPTRIEQILQEYNKQGHLFLWSAKGRRWGFFVNWEEHYYSGSTQYNEQGERIKHRRKTPEPPKEALGDYLEQFGTKRDNLEQSASKPKPNPKHKPKDSKAGKPVLSKTTKDLLDNVYKQGFNIYALLGRFKKKSKIDLPEAVIEKVCGSYLKNHEKIQNDWAWFITAVEKASREYFAERSIKEGQEWKKQPVAQSIRDIMRKVAS